MRILLASTASHLPPRGGSTRSNLAWLRLLAARGHACRVLAGALEREGEAVVDSIAIRSVRDLPRHVSALADEVRAFAPDWVLVSSEDLGHSLVREAARAAPGRLLYLAHTPQLFPFGPESWNPDARATSIVRDARAIVTIGRHMAGYVREHLGRDATVLHPPIYGAPPYPVCGAFSNEWVLMVNPCAVKGLPIFLALAARFPALRFAALAGWGTTRRDAEEIARWPNACLLESVRDIDEVLCRARVLLMPSLWYEGFGLIAMEAMLRGVPVIASESGGLAEAKLATGYVVPVRPILRYEPAFDEAHMPRPVVEPQPIEAWARALETLSSDAAAWRAESERSRRVALEFVSRLDPGAFERLLESLRPRAEAQAEAAPRLRILLAHNSLYYPARGGGDISNRLLMEALAARGHTVRVVARTEAFGEQAQARHLADLAARGVAASVEEEAAVAAGGAVRAVLNGVDVRTLTRNPHLRAYLAAQIDAFDPDVIVASTDDPAQLLLEVALRAPRARVVYLVRATIAVPFGPDSSSPSAARSEVLRRVDGCVGVSRYVTRYLAEHGGIPAVHLPISLLEAGEPPMLASFDNPYVSMVNPCAVKGIDVFLALAARLPHLAFAAVPTWGTTAADLARLARLENITLLPPADRIDEILRRTRVLLVPSVWAEARSRVVPEAMARGVPVISSNLGGLPEAKLGVDYTLPLGPLTGYRPGVDENMVPLADVPDQDVAPWVEALGRLSSDRGHWEAISRASREAALTYARSLGVEPFETFLREVVARPRRAAASSQPAGSGFSEDRQRLLALRLRRRAQARPAPAADPFFPLVEAAPPGGLRLFCFPYAGGGTLPYLTWKGALAAVASLCPVLLPGRETRLAEPPFERMEELVAELRRRILPLLDGPFAFFGHSFGAGIAFELARSLRAGGQPLPRVVILSAARAPRFRSAPTGQPLPDQDLPHGGKLDDAEWRRLALAALRADTELYRNHVFAEDDPLPVPLIAYGGAGDPAVTAEHLEGWRAHTSSTFALRTFAGSHSYLETSRDEVVSALALDLAAALRRG